MTKLEQLKKKIVEKVPEIMALEFGCKVKHHEEGSCTILFQDHSYDKSWYLMIDIDNTQTYSREKNFNIIGREITLADVLRAMEINSTTNHHNKNDFNKLEYGVNRNVFWIGNEITHQSCDWNLSQPLSGQSPETIDFLLTLLNN